MLTSLIVTSSINASNIHLQTSAALAELSTKYREHSHRSTKGVMALHVHIHDVSIEVASQKNEFLRYTANKKQLVKLPQAGFEKCKLTYGKVRRMQTLS